MTLSITWLYQVVGTPWSSTQSHLLITLSTPIVTKLEHQLLAVTYKVSHDGASVWHSPHPTCSASLTVLQPADFLKHSQVFPVSGHLHLPFILLGMNRMIPRSSKSENILFIFRSFQLIGHLLIAISGVSISLSCLFFFIALSYNW